MDFDFVLLWDKPEIKAKYGGTHLPFLYSGSRDEFRLDLAMQQDLDSNKSKHCLLSLFL